MYFLIIFCCCFTQPITRVLNGKEALATTCNLPSSEEEEDEDEAEESVPGVTRHKFSHPDHVKQLLKSNYHLYF